MCCLIQEARGVGEGWVEVNLLNRGPRLSPGPGPRAWFIYFRFGRREEEIQRDPDRSRKTKVVNL